MPYLVDHTIQAVILLAVTFLLPGYVPALFGIPEYWSFVILIAMIVVITAWSFHRGSHGKGPLW